MDDQFIFDAAPSSDYVVLAEEALRYLPPEWRTNLLELKADGQAVLEAANDDLNKLVRLANAFPNVVSLQYIQHRLASAAPPLTMELVLEHEMLTLAFVVAYSRVIEGGNGSGVARNALPPELREAHDQIIEWRNQRFAHNGTHETVAQGLEIGLQDGRFDVNIRFNMTYRFQGAPEWAALTNFLNELMYTRLQKILDRLREKTGREWTFPSGPGPTFGS